MGGSYLLRSVEGDWEKAWFASAGLFDLVTESALHEFRGSSLEPKLEECLKTGLRALFTKWGRRFLDTLPTCRRGTGPTIRENWICEDSRLSKVGRCAISLRPV